jgi:hypothetical protein
MRNATRLLEEDVYALVHISVVSLMARRDVGKRFHDREMVNGTL